jgi:L-2,4-diaminobutyrate decarboxylase
MKRSAIDAEFLTDSGADRYIEAVTAAAHHVTAALLATSRPGLVAGSSLLRKEIRKLELAPRNGVGLDVVLSEVAELVIPNSTTVSNPRYAAHLHCPPAVSGLAAETMLSALNQSMDSYDQGPAAAVIEQYVIDWMCDLLGYDAGDGVFTSGGTQSNLQALLLARDTHARDTLGWNIARDGLPSSSRNWRIMCTSETHFTVELAARLLGLGTASIVHVETDRDGRLDPGSLRTSIQRCHEAHRPVIALVLNAGTTDRGVIDPIFQSCMIAREHGIWVHVDAAAGGCLMLSDRYRHLLASISEADSVAVDFHKLLFQPISCGALFLRRKSALDILAKHVDYLNPVEDDPGETPNLVAKSLQTTRRFDALKVFVTLRALGINAVAQMIESTVDAARAASRAAAADHRLRVIGAAATNTVLIRWTSPTMTSAALDDVNTMIRRQLAAEGHALIGRTRVAEGVALKLTFVNPVCTPQTAHALIQQIAARGERIANAQPTEETNEEQAGIAS